jgi:phage terminase small subunit
MTTKAENPKKSKPAKVVSEKSPPESSVSKKVVSKKSAPKTAPANPNSTEAIHKTDIREKLFVDAYLADPKLNGTKAAIAAGFSERSARATATNLLKNPNIIQLIKERQAARGARTEITQDYVLKVCCEVVERCRQAKPVLDKFGHHILVETPSGDMAPAYTFDAANVLRGIELLGKHTGTFIERREISGPGGKPIQQTITAVDPIEAAKQYQILIAET